MGSSVLVLDFKLPRLVPRLGGIKKLDRLFVSTQKVEQSVGVSIDKTV